MNNIQQAKNIISKIFYATIATITLNGEPWNSPVYTAYDEDLNFYWVSWRENIHSKNILANKQAFIVIYDSSVAEGTGQGVYIKARVTELNEKSEIEHAIKYHYLRKNKPPRSAEEFMGENMRRFYKAIPEKVWVNDAERDLEGNFIKDYRVEVPLDELKNV